MVTILRPSKQRSFKRKIVGFDVETHGQKNDFYCASFYCDEFQMTFMSIDETLRFMKSDIMRGSCIVATNLQFDLYAVFTRENMDMTKIRPLMRGSDVISAKAYVRDGEFVLEKNSHKDNSLYFLDTMNYAKMSVSDIGKILKVPKLEKPTFLGKLPKNVEESEQLITYNMRDAEISCKFMKFLFSTFSEFGATPKMTIASTAMSLFRNKYLKGVYFQPCVEDLDKIFKAYYGGRTEMFKRGKLPSGYHLYDFNSLYPAMMLEDFPDPNFQRHTRCGDLKFVSDFEGVSDVSVSCPPMAYPLLPCRMNKKLVFPTGSFRGWYCHNELRKALELGYVIEKVHESIYYLRKCSPFRELITDMYEKRLKYKAEGNPMEVVAKLLMNSFSGKFGQKFRDKEELVPFDCLREGELEGMVEFERLGDFVRIKKPYSRPASFCFPIWVAYVTAKGRIKLHDVLTVSEGVYCDTDSIVTDVELPCGDGLGFLKKEMSIVSGVLVRPKFYRLEGSEFSRIKLKGFGRKLLASDFNDAVAGHPISYVKFTKLKEAVRRGLRVNELRDVMKDFCVEDDKRVWPGFFDAELFQDSVPLCLKCLYWCVSTIG